MSEDRIDALIFDLDGTLYSQKEVRRVMLWRLVKFYCLRPHKIRQLFSLFLFRQMRECPSYQACSMPELFQRVSRRTKLPADEIRDTVQFWMFDNPLDVIKRCAYHDVIDFINASKKHDRKIIIYSDYPVVQKLKALSVEADFVFVSGEGKLAEQKPSRISMKYILDTIVIPPERILYVGDRDEKDKVSAEMVNVKYLDILEFRKLLKEGFL